MITESLPLLVIKQNYHMAVIALKYYQLLTCNEIAYNTVNNKPVVMLVPSHFLIPLGDDYDLGRNVSKLHITFPAGTTCAPFDIPIVDDNFSEANETFTVSIINNSLPFGLKLEDPDNAVLTIVDNDCKCIL